MDGVELIREIKESFPDLKVLAMSGGGGGFSAEHTTDLMMNLGADAVLQKPITNDEFLSVIDTLVT
jgi:DNA-binding NarL/FixJ family response regulator